MGGGSQTSTTVQNNEPYGPAQPLINQGLADAQALYNSGGFNITPYQGDLVADADPFRNSVYEMAPGLVDQQLAGAQAAQGGIMRALDPNIRSEAFDQVRQNTINSVMPQINSSFAGSGMTGSSLHAQNLAQGLTAGLADVENQAFQQGENRALQAASMMGQANQNINAPLQYLNALGGQRQAQEQAEIQANVLQDQQAQAGELNALQDYLALTTGAGSMFGVQSSSTTQQGGGAGPFDVLGFGLQAAPLLFSDRRLKRDIKRVGYTDDGLPIYTYRYLWDDTVQMGVMSDELREVNPSAVSEIQGFEAVDYALL